MEAPVNAARFFEQFDFMSGARTCLLACLALLFSALSASSPNGTGRALSLVMLKKNEKLNTQDGALPVITAADFAAEVLASNQPVLVEFWTSWSRPCQVFESVLHEVAHAWAGKIKVVKVNADDSLELSLLYDIRSIPMLLCFVEGSPRWRILGTATIEAIEAKLDPLFQ
jgi:thioredoxin 1